VDKHGFTACKEHYQLSHVIGQGATAVVQQAVFTNPNTQEKHDCAIKRIYCEKITNNLDMAREVEYMLKCRHENIVHYYTSFVVRDELWVVMNLLSGGSVYDIIKHRMKQGNSEQGVFDEIEIATVLKEALAGLEYLHANGQIHRDIKAGNILLGRDGTVQLADFGVSAMLSIAGDRTHQGRRETFVGTPCWMAPEVMEQAKGYDIKADIWSFGIVAIELATGAAPYSKYPPMKVILLTLQNQPPNLDTVDKEKYKKYSKEFRKMIQRCLQKEPHKRPSAKDLLKDPFFKKAKEKTKSKEFIVQKLLVNAPSLKERSKKAKRVPGSSGRLHKLKNGMWEFSDEEMDPTTEEGIQAISEKGDREPTTEIATNEKLNDDDVKKIIQIKLNLRIRNEVGELQDVSFPFIVDTDTPNAVSQEMMQSSIIESEDMVIVASRISHLVEVAQKSSATESERSVRFRVRTGTQNGSDDDMEKLRGFAQLTIED